MSFAIIIVSLLSATIRSGTIVLYSTIGAIFNERSGILNLGIEGMMLMGAFMGFYVALHTSSLFLAILCAAIVGGLMALIHAFITITMRANQVVSGLALTMFGGGLSAYFGKDLVGLTLSAKVMQAIEPVPIPVLNKIPILGDILFNHNILVYISFVIPFAAWYVLNKTRWGLAIRSSGEEPLSSEIMGIKVIKVRYISTVVGGIFCGIGGAYLSVGYTPLWIQGMTAGRGWITIALVIFSNWNPLIAFGGAYLFGGLEALQLRLQALGFNVPTFLLATTPYLFTIIFLLLITLKGTRSNLPKNLGIPYFRESRE
jgi:simple sugar transport system permease protein